MGLPQQAGAVPLLMLSSLVIFDRKSHWYWELLSGPNDLRELKGLYEWCVICAVSALGGENGSDRK